MVVRGVPIIPLPSDVETGPCLGCVANNPPGEEIVTNLTCTQLPACGGIVWAEASDETLAAYLALRLEGKGEPGG